MDNPYKTPESVVGSSGDNQPDEPYYELASRWRRLFAAILDGFIIVGIATPIIFFSGIMDEIGAEGVSPAYAIGGFIAGFGLYLLVNARIRQTEHCFAAVGKRFFWRSAQ